MWASMCAERDLSVSSDSTVSGASSCCVSSLSLSSLPTTSANRRSYGARALQPKCFSVPEPRGLAQETSSALSFASIDGLAAELLALLRATEYDVYHVQCVATEAMASLQVVRLHLIERTLHATVRLEEPWPSQDSG
ncbi:hypothetical protein, unknown function [Leishmania tarentolae]|uniref:Uncharacterized protein n=1 Tax=Leishmania tarentolae TaxID=5689 RepID=A0A640KG53_LEITA|nr:hypothetical protein, unknown function [Leishmania tarentolae]